MKDLAHGDDQTGMFLAVRLLNEHGFKEMQGLKWEMPSRNYFPTTEERYAILYLVEKWGFGGVTTMPVRSREPVQYGGAY